MMNYWSGYLKNVIKPFCTLGPSFFFVIPEVGHCWSSGRQAGDGRETDPLRKGKEEIKRKSKGNQKKQKHTCQKTNQETFHSCLIGVSLFIRSDTYYYHYYWIE